ncbi:MAG: hypothetical protein WA209_04040 [Candidatus Acidiferrales bacterium]
MTADLTPKSNFAGSAAEAVAGAETRDDGEFVSRPLYPYSVVPGGITSADELRAAELSDALVRDHYVGLSLANAHVERLAEAKSMYVSYRRGNKIFWTKNAVRLAKGERVITDGVVMLRARCGNRISEVPMAPVEPSTAAVPAAAMELPAAEGLPLLPALPADVPLAPVPETAIVIPEFPTTAPPVIVGGYAPPWMWIPTGGGPSSSGPTTPSGGTPSGPSGPTPPSGPQPPPVIVPPSGPGSPSGPGAPSGPGTPGAPPIATPEPGEFAMLVAGMAGILAMTAPSKKRAA